MKNKEQEDLHVNKSATIPRRKQSVGWVQPDISELLETKVSFINFINISADRENWRQFSFCYNQQKPRFSVFIEDR